MNPLSSTCAATMRREQKITPESTSISAKAMTVHIFIHRQVPVRDIKVLLARVFKDESHETAFGDENIEKRVGGLAGGQTS